MNKYGKNLSNYNIFCQKRENMAVIIKDVNYSKVSKIKELFKLGIT